MNTEYLEKFFRNLLLGESNELRNRYCHIKYNETVAIKSQKSSDNVATKEKSIDIILNYLKENDSIDCVKAFEKKSGDGYESYSEWLGIKNLDITYFNKNAVNKSLKNQIKAIDKAYKTME